VAGTVVSVATPVGIIMGRADGQALFNLNNSTNVIYVTAANGQSVMNVERRLLALRGPADDFRVSQTNRVRAHVLGIFSRNTSLYYGVLGVAVLIGALGLANTLAITVIERQQEIGVLRALGTHRRGIAAMVITESVTLAIVALALALPLGALVSLVTVKAVAQAVGYRPHFIYPWSAVPAVAVLALLLALTGALIPARRAARLPIVSTLRFA
jgi:putative ABC transport system permease protein